MKKIKKWAALVLIMAMVLQTALSASAATVVSTDKAPDYETWMANTLINGIEGNGSWYKTFRGLQEPVYKTLGGEVLNDKPLVSLSTTWSVMLNSTYRKQFANEQKYIYEVILMDYLKYGASQKLSTNDLLGSEFKYSVKLYQAIVKELNENTMNYLDSEMSVDEASRILKNVKAADNISTAISKVSKGISTVKKLIGEVSDYLALMEVKEDKITLLKASKAAAGKNKDYAKAVDDVVEALDSIDVKYVQGKGLDYLWDKTMDKAWSKLTTMNPVLKTIEKGVSNLDKLFDTTNSASNNLKLALLYTVDNYMLTGMLNARDAYSNKKTTANAKKFRECFEGYVQFQMFGNTYAKSWLGQYLEGGKLKDAFNRIFKKENIKTAKDLQKRCDTQTEGRKKVLKGISTCSSIYQSKYPLTKEVETPKATLKLSSSSLTLYTSGKTTGTLKATVTGNSKTVTWTTSDKKVATVKNGKVTAVGAGKCKITASANGVKKSCSVTVKKASLKLNKSSLTLYTSGKTTETLKATVTGKNKTVAWTTSDKKVATVKNGKVTAVGMGKCKIAASANGVKTFCNVTVKNDAQDVVAVSCGYAHTAILKKDGSLWMTGYNDCGALGDGTTTDKSTPIKVMNGVTSVSCGNYHTAILKKDGSLWMTGANYWGQLGDVSYSYSYTPVKVMSDVASVSCGYKHTAILKKNGSLWMTGSNSEGELGIDKVMSNVTSVSFGEFHTAILKKDGSLWMIGDNSSGALGDGTRTNKSTPVKVMSNVASVSCGSRHTAILKNDGSLWMTGSNYAGGLGDGTTIGKSTPVKVMSNVVSVSCGSWFTAILKKDGSLWMTGYNPLGELGDGTTRDKYIPVKVMSDVSSVSCGCHYTAILKKDGSLWMTGSNSYGQLGDGTTTERHTPVKIM